MVIAGAVIVLGIAIPVVDTAMDGYRVTLAAQAITSLSLAVGFLSAREKGPGAARVFSNLGAAAGRRASATFRSLVQWHNTSWLAAV